MAKIDHGAQPSAEKIRGSHQKSALKIFQKLSVIALETGRSGKAKIGVSPREERRCRIIQGRLNSKGNAYAPGSASWKCDA
ncbi:hypothetical protein [Zoogloea sp.]|uniref:hypothetical protein n=1 Tax=Zoogloea sp. TaxID=49181 RepID=UPI0026355F69|nr:hypothetical protein [Zoogloea sp.]MDD3354448.1 hypothetical protein [Zoogloea sp.]